MREWFFSWGWILITAISIYLIIAIIFVILQPKWIIKWNSLEEGKRKNFVKVILILTGSFAIIPILVWIGFLISGIIWISNSNKDEELFISYFPFKNPTDRKQQKKLIWIFLGFFMSFSMIVLVLLAGYGLWWR